MHLLAINIGGITLPFEHPVMIFTLILFIILFSYIILDRVKVPYLLGLIVAGIIVGPFGLNLLARDSSIILFGTVGLLYIMFIAGLEIDIVDFKKHLSKSILFGLYTFCIPMLLGIVTGVYLLGYSVMTSVLLASMYASNTLITYPIVSKLGIARNRAVNISIGGTLITTLLALFVLAVIVRMTSGDITPGFWGQLSISIILFSAVILFGFPIIGRWFFKRVNDNISQYIFVLGMVFLGSVLAEISGIEGIVGAFMAGLALNRLIPKTSALMNRIEFVGNALFIPFFLIGVGMLINFRAFVGDWNTIKVAVVMCVVATVAKYLPAWLAQKTYKLTTDEGMLIFGLTNSQAASTLAAVLVGYNVILGTGANGEPVRLLDDAILNGTILMILVTCTVASFVTQKRATNIALSETVPDDDQYAETEERLLIPLSNAANVEELVTLSTTMKPKNRGRLIALNVITDVNVNAAVEKKAREIMNKAAVAASTTDNRLKPLLRYDLNIVNGISNVVKEYRITDLVIGLHEKKGISDSFLGMLTEGILAKCNASTFIYRPFQPLATVKRHIVIIPRHAEKEYGFAFWMIRIWKIAINTGAKLVFYASEETTAFLKHMQERKAVDSEFHIFPEWDDFLVLSGKLKTDDNLIIVMSRRSYPSYVESMSKIPEYLDKYFKKNSFIIVFPMQPEYTSISEDGDLVMEPVLDHVERLDDFSRLIERFVKKK